MSTTCETCGGQGTYTPSSAQCKPCDGVGRVSETKTVLVTIPAGVDHGMKVRVAGRGDEPLEGNGPTGDLYVVLEVSFDYSDIYFLSFNVLI
jgi:molecular chaperone DnaJ